MEKKDRITRARAGGLARGRQERQQALQRYNAAPHHCLNCGDMLEVEDRRVADVIKKKFCDYSCSSAYSNRKRREAALTSAPPAP